MDIIVDIDGTLADLTHRRHWVTSKPKNWPAFNAGVQHDTVIEPVAALVRTLHAAFNTVILCSGRSEDLRAATVAWLKRHDIRWCGLYMRTAGDCRADDIIKSELLDQILLDGFNPEIAFDDRDRVVAMWRRRGLICAQVAEGNF